MDENKVIRIKTSGRAHFFIMNFIRIMLVLAFLGALQHKRWLVLFVSVLALLVTFLPRVIDRKWGVKIPGEFEVMILLFIYGTLFFGEVRGFYARFWWWDILLNFGASVALGFVGLTVLYVLYRDEKIDASPFMIAFFAFCFALSIGTLWEVFEFSVDTFLGFNLQRSSLTDSMKDIIAVIVGAFLVSISGYYYIKSGKRNIVSKIVMKFIERNPKMFRSEKSVSSSDRIKELIKKGEGRKLEFKSTLRTNLHSGFLDRKIEHGVLKTLVAYLNSNGGTLLVGVSDKGELIGIEKDGFTNQDMAGLYFTNLIKHRIGNAFLPLIQFEILEAEGKLIFKVDCQESDRQVFLKTDGEEEFFVRNGPSTAQLKGSVLVDYIERKFRGD